MPPNIQTETVTEAVAEGKPPLLSEATTKDINDNPVIAKKLPEVWDPNVPRPVPREYVLRSISILTILHVLGVWGAWYTWIACSWPTHLHGWFWGLASGLGVTAGAHRLWAHRSYQAALPLRVVLMLMFSVAGQNDLHEWVRDHRLHHRHSETDADPHNARRGFFFAHCGWLFVRKHPEVRRQGAKIDLSDVLADPVVRFHRAFFLPLVILFSLVIPSAIPCLLWGEDPTISLLISCHRLCLSLHCTWLVNSAAHLYGMHPYDDHINPAENIVVAYAALGEGWHNYHHVFPWDYRAAELPTYGANLTTGFIDFFAKLGLVSGRKIVDREIVRRRAERTGDGSWEPSFEFDARHAEEILAD